MNDAPLYAMTFARVYPRYVPKAEKKGRTQAEVDEIIRWLTGYSQAPLEQAIADRTSFADFFAGAPALNLARSLITGLIYGRGTADAGDTISRQALGRAGEGGEG